MTPEDAASAVNKFWVYEPDGPIDHWSFKSPGDCENYALLVLSRIVGGDRAAKRALLRGDTHIWYVKTWAGNGHAVLEYNGRFIDNRFRRWKDSLDDMKLLDSPRRRYSRLSLIVKLGVGGLFW